MTEDPLRQPTPGSDVFVSYASQDAAVASSIVEYLEKQGVECWIAPRNITPGSQYADEIVGAINDAKILILVLSEHAVASTHVGKELERASSKRRRIIALRTDAAPLTRSFEYFLSESQWIDVAALGMPGALLKLTQAVGQQLSPSSWVSPGLGVDASYPAYGRPKPSYLTIKRLVAAAVFLVIAAVVAGVLVRYWPSKQEGGAEPAVASISDKSIAVLPFVDMSEKKDQEYFADGMSEEILDLLTKIPGLTVIGRTSSFQFKGKNEDLRSIGTKLNAAYLLEGSVRKSGDQVRITAQLINAQTGAHEWSETYDRPIGDVLKMQDAIAAAVVRELQLTVSPGYLSSRSVVKDAAAYDLMLRGRHAADFWNQEGFDEAATLFQQAINRDPTSADAAVGLAWAYENQGEFGFSAPATAFELARRAAATALRLNPKSAEAHAVLARIHTVYDWDWTGAESEFQQTVALAPGNEDALNGEAALFLALGRWDDALRQIKAALAQDPLDASNFSILAYIQLRRGQLTEAKAAARRALEIRPDFADAHWLLGILSLLGGDGEGALGNMQQESDEAQKEIGLAEVYFALGRKRESDGLLAHLIEEQTLEDAFDIAELYAFRGQADDAMHWLELAYAQKDSGLFYIKGDPLLKSLESDARYKAFLEKMNLPE